MHYFYLFIYFFYLLQSQLDFVSMVAIFIIFLNLHCRNVTNTGLLSPSMVLPVCQWHITELIYSSLYPTVIPLSFPLPTMLTRDLFYLLKLWSVQRQGKSWCSCTLYIIYNFFCTFNQVGKGKVIWVSENERNGVFVFVLPVVNSLSHPNTHTQPSSFA